MKTWKFLAAAAASPLLLAGCDGDDVSLIMPAETQDWGIYQKVRMPDGMICYVYTPEDGSTGLSCSTDFKWANAETIVIDADVEDVDED
ncbi:MAG: hypothetical protein O7G86_19405 [Gammaproteobacteria bacterium]|nr:hypothetical protein [Gammaproteobacteria bacterium]MCZ6856089.1 hypothetical protein [Gammaproteobacteria bacterium]